MPARISQPDSSGAAQKPGDFISGRANRKWRAAKDGNKLWIEIRRINEWERMPVKKPAIRSHPFIRFPSVDDQKRLGLQIQSYRMGRRTVVLPPRPTTDLE